MAKATKSHKARQNNLQKAQNSLKATVEEVPDEGDTDNEDNWDLDLGNELPDMDCALCMDKVTVLWSVPTAHRPREVKGPVPSSISTKYYPIGLVIFCATLYTWFRVKSDVASVTCIHVALSPTARERGFSNKDMRGAVPMPQVGEPCIQERTIIYDFPLGRSKMYSFDNCERVRRTEENTEMNPPRSLLGYPKSRISRQITPRSLGMQDFDKALEPPTTPIDAPWRLASPGLRDHLFCCSPPAPCAVPPGSAPAPHQTVLPSPHSSQACSPAPAGTAAPQRSAVLAAAATQSRATRGRPARGGARPTARARSRRMTPLRAGRPPLPAQASPAPGRSSTTCSGPWESKELCAPVTMLSRYWQDIEAIPTRTEVRNHCAGELELAHAEPLVFPECRAREAHSNPQLPPPRQQPSVSLYYRNVSTAERQ
ncbi:hypothetical protein DFH08DRAFT_806902 [Mycena albidolilacea]|uniref:Uncharacterized protein n=1 Tax=Mycena albidolilacea TaxID=1033008 RepID=A0AAD7A771_9AGAR|nr:hypothetical protein DFH08DRAFT_806902 [Mycena albidolilacea]